MRNAEIKRDTNETKISLSLCLDGKGNADVNTSCPFLDHMLTLFAKHGRFDLSVKCDGDIEVDYHHTVEDVGICLGKAFANALGTCCGIVRYGDITLPMDEALILCAVDVSGRSYLGYEIGELKDKVGDFDTELCEEFWIAFVQNAKLTLHIRRLAGRNTHHILEGSFKAAARAIRKAVAIDPDACDEIPSSKGVI